MDFEGDREAPDDGQLALNSSGEHDQLETNGRKQRARKEQYTSKQRLDMYAFCVLELEMHSNTVSIKKRQQAIKRALSRGPISNGKLQADTKQEPANSNCDAQELTSGTAPTSAESNAAKVTQATTTTTANNPTNAINSATSNQAANTGDKPIDQSVIQRPGAQVILLSEDVARELQQQGALIQKIEDGGVPPLTDEEKTLEQLQNEISPNLKCYSDYQRTLVLTAAMLKSVQLRFSKYYPNSVVPSKTTIKHVFDKCVLHGTVDNIRNPRKPSKITQGSELEMLLQQEPQLSLRQLAARLNVSVGTVSRRCKALGMIPESVTLKHQQLAMARRQRQAKQQGSMTPTQSTPRKVGRPRKIDQVGGCTPRRAQRRL